MEIDQLKSTWQQKVALTSSEQSINSENNMIAIEESMKALDLNVKQRTLYGAIAFTLVIVSMVFFTYFLYVLGNSLILTMGVATWVVSLTIAMIRLFLLKNSYSMNENTLNIEASLRHKLSKVESEIQFYHSIIWKILAPLSIGFVLILVGTNASLLMASGQMTFFLLCCYWSYRYNKHYVAKNLTPIKENIIENLNALS